MSDSYLWLFCLYNIVKYSECFSILKNKIVTVNFEELEKYMNIQKDIENYFFYVSNNNINEFEIQQSREKIQEYLKYLEQYSPKQQIDGYKGYLDYKSGNNILLLNIGRSKCSPSIAEFNINNKKYPKILKFNFCIKLYIRIFLILIFKQKIII